MPLNPEPVLFVRVGPKFEGPAGTTDRLFIDGRGGLRAIEALLGGSLVIISRVISTLMWLQPPSKGPSIVLVHGFWYPGSPTVPQERGLGAIETERVQV